MAKKVKPAATAKSLGLTSTSDEDDSDEVFTIKSKIDPKKVKKEKAEKPEKEEEKKPPKKKRSPPSKTKLPLLAREYYGPYHEDYEPERSRHGSLPVPWYVLRVPPERPARRPMHVVRLVPVDESTPNKVPQYCRAYLPVQAN